MMRAWCNILPMFAVRWLSKHHSERFQINGVGVAVMPFADVIILVTKEPRHEA
jgi:hypothetical protein